MPLNTFQDDGSIIAARLECRRVSDRPAVTFSETFSEQIEVRIGNVAALISRREIAAVSKLFPYVPQPPRPR